MLLPLTALLSVSTLALESWAPHLFTAPDVYRQLQAEQFALSADRKDEDLQFLSLDDLSALRSMASSQVAAKNTPPAAELRKQTCDIPRVETPISLDDFMLQYGSAPAVISTKAASGVASLPFPITSKLVKHLQPEGSLSPCLCYPEHGTNFFENQPGTKRHDETSSSTKRYCLWQLPLFIELLFGNKSFPSRLTQIPETEGAMADDQLVANLELATALDFQCRVGVTRFRDDAPDPRQRLVRTIVNSLGSDQPAPRRGSDRHAASGSWWGRANLDDSKHIHSAMLWLSTARTRTPLHTDNRMQWLVQLQGTKHVTVYPDAAGISASDAIRLKHLANTYGGPLDPSLQESAMGEGPAGGNASSLAMQRCLLRPGEVLWLPDGVMHDVFAIDASISLNIRFNSLAATNDRPRRSKRRRRQDL